MFSKLMQVAVLVAGGLALGGCPLGGPKTAAPVKKPPAPDYQMAAAAPTGTSAFTCESLNPKRRARKDETPAPICTDGPSRPSAIPLASEMEQQRNLPTTVRREMKPL